MGRFGELFWGIYDSRVSQVTARLREEMVKDKELLKLTNRLRSHFMDDTFYISGWRKNKENRPL
jgi:hypothetical protein